MRKVIAICGKPGSGKQTLADDLLWRLSDKGIKCKRLRLGEESLNNILEKIGSDEETIFIVIGNPSQKDAQVIHDLYGAVIRLNRPLEEQGPTTSEKLDGDPNIEFVYQNVSTTKIMLNDVTRYLSNSFSWFRR
jgi:hypothetical protein